MFSDHMQICIPLMSVSQNRAHSRALLTMTGIFNCGVDTEQVRVDTPRGKDLNSEQYGRSIAGPSRGELERRL